MQIDVRELERIIDQDDDVTIIDVRTNPEFHSERIHVDHVRNYPLNEIESLPLDKSQKVYVLCQTGQRSAQAQQRLLAAGFTEVICISGGINDWKSAGLALTKTAGTFPIMRQVQIVAGSLMLVGALGSLYIAPGFIWLAVFVGAGLTFAGLSGFCGMALMLGKMPWNRAMQAS